MEIVGGAEALAGDGKKADLDHFEHTEGATL